MSRLVSDEAHKKKPIDKVTLAFVVALLGGAALLGWQEAFHGAGIMPEGTPAPAFSVQRPRGDFVSLESLRGKVVVVNFWATWCGPCREEIPYLIRAIEDFSGEGVALVAISNDDLDKQREAVDEYVRRVPQLGPYVALGRPDVGHAYGVRALPSMFIIDRQGRVVASHQGQASESQIRRWLKNAVAD